MANQHVTSNTFPHLPSLYDTDKLSEQIASSSDDGQISGVNSEYQWSDDELQLDESIYGELSEAIQMKGRPTVIPAKSFSTLNDLANLNSSFKLFSTDKNALIDVLCKRSLSQRLEIAKAYEKVYQRKLFNDIQSKTSGHLQRLLLALLMPKYEFLARVLNEAMYGDNNDNAIIEIICSLTNYEQRELNRVYHRTYGKSLKRALSDNTSGNYKRLLTLLSEGIRDESMSIDFKSAQIEAQDLKKAGIDRWGADASVFNRVFSTRNYEQIQLIAIEYKNLTGNSLEHDIEKKFTDAVRNTLLSILTIAQGRCKYFAVKLHKALSSFVTDHKAFVRLIVTTCEVDLEDIKDEFINIYGKKLNATIRASGYYRKALDLIVGVD